MDLSSQLEFNGIKLPLPEFRPHLEYLPALSLLVFLAEDIGYVSQWVNSRMCIYRHPQENRLVGLEFWLHYNPQLLLPAPM